MSVGRRALASAAIGLTIALVPLSAALATGEVGTCALSPGCVDLDAPDEVVDAADEVSQGAGKVLDEAKETSGELTGGGTDPVTDPVVGGINDTLDLTPGQPNPGTTPEKHKKKRSASQQRRPGSAAGSGESAAAIAAYERTFDMMAAREARRGFDAASERAVSFLPPSQPGLRERLAQAALEAAKAFGFPAILIGLMVGFVLVQNRIDHRDPKLAIAPVSSEQDYLSFT